MVLISFAILTAIIVSNTQAYSETTYSNRNIFYFPLMAERKTAEFILTCPLLSVVQNLGNQTVQFCDCREYGGVGIANKTIAVRAINRYYSFDWGNSYCPAGEITSCGLGLNQNYSLTVQCFNMVKQKSSFIQVSFFRAATVLGCQASRFPALLGALGRATQYPALLLPTRLPNSRDASNQPALSFTPHRVRGRFCSCSTWRWGYFCCLGAALTAADAAGVAFKRGC